MHKTKVISSSYRLPHEVHMGGIPLANSMAGGETPATAHIEMWLMGVGRGADMQPDRLWYYTEMVAMPKERAIGDDRAAMLGASIDNSKWATRNQNAPRVRAVFSMSAAALLSNCVLDMPVGTVETTLVPAGIFIGVEDNGIRTSITSPMLSVVLLDAWEKSARQLCGSLAFPHDMPEDWNHLRVGMLAENEYLPEHLTPEQLVQHSLSDFSSLGILDASSDSRNSLYRAASGRLTALPALPPLVMHVIDRALEQTRETWDFKGNASPIPTPGIFNFHRWTEHHQRADEYDHRPLSKGDPSGATYIEWCEQEIEAGRSTPELEEGRLNAVFTQVSMPRVVCEMLQGFCSSTDTWDEEVGGECSHITLDHERILMVRDHTGTDGDEGSGEVNLRELRKLAHMLEEQGVPEQEIEQVLNSVMAELEKIEPEIVADIRKQEDEELEELRRLFGVGD